MIAGGTDMSNGDCARQAKDLRHHATFLLHEAALCGDPARRDGLLREAVAQLDKARRLLDRLDAGTEVFGSGSTGSMH